MTSANSDSPPSPKDSAAEGPRFRSYRAEDREPCLALFDANCPAFFAPNEREDYARFLDPVPAGYEVALDAEGTGIVGAFGLTRLDAGCGRLNWILIDPSRHGRGLGRAMIARVRECALEWGLERILVAASQHSAPFFARFGAFELQRTADGFGPGMDRVDMVLAPQDPSSRHPQ